MNEARAGLECTNPHEMPLISPFRRPRSPVPRPSPRTTPTGSYIPQPAGHVDTFADEVEPWQVARHHAAGREPLGRDAAKGDFGGAVSFRAAGAKVPGAKPRDHLGERRVGLVGEIARRQAGSEVIDEAGGQVAREFGGEVAPPGGLPLFAQGRQQAASRVEIEGDLFALAPIG